MNRLIQLIRSTLAPRQRKPSRPSYDAAVSVKHGTGVVLRDGEIVSVLPPQAVLGIHAAAVERGRTVAAQRKKKAST